MGSPSPSPTASVTPSRSPTGTRTPSRTSTPSRTPTRTVTPTPSETKTPSKTRTASKTHTPTPTPTNTGPSVLVYGSAGTPNDDLVQTLQATQLLGAVSSAATSTIVALAPYDVVLLYFRSVTQTQWASIMPNMISYIDGGGYVVLANCFLMDDMELSPPWTNVKYQVIDPAPSYMTTGTPKSLDLSSALLNHPIMAGVYAFDELPYKAWNHAMANTVVGGGDATIVARWTGGNILVATRKNVGKKSVCRVDLNTYPVPALNNFGNDGIWDPATDGGRLIANAILFAFSNCTISSVSPTPTRTPSLSQSSSATATKTATPSASQSVTRSETRTPTLSSTPTTSTSESQSATTTTSPSASLSPSGSRSVSPTTSLSPTVTPTMSLSSSISPSPGYGNVLVLHSDSPLYDEDYASDVKWHLAFFFATVSSMALNETSPTLGYLQTFNAVLIYMQTAPFDAVGLGSVLTAFVDQGGKLVVAGGCLTAVQPILWNTTGYSYDVLRTNYTMLGHAGMGYIPTAHMILVGVGQFDGGFVSSRAGGGYPLPSGTEVFAYWNTSEPLVAQRRFLGPSLVCRVDVNIYPPSDAVARPEGWTAGTHGGRLLGNALKWVMDNCPGTMSPSPTESLSPSLTSTPSPTASSSATRSSTHSRTPSRTTTPSRSTSESASTTASLTPSLSESASASTSESTTQTATSSPSASRTSARSNTGSISESTTATVTPSMTSSTTPSTTATVTPSMTSSTTPSTTATVTLTSSTTPSTTATVTPSTTTTPSASLTLSTSWSSTASASVTQTPAPSTSPDTPCGPLAQTQVIFVLFRNESSSGTASVRYECLNAGPASPVVIDEQCTALGWSVVPATACVATASCLGQGTWFVDGTCQPCPAGAFCPGGTVLWPKRGYWSSNEGERPLPCRNADACPGSVGEENPVRLLATARKTDNCAEGYTGPYCALCMLGYYKSYDNCLLCPSNANASFTSLVIAAVVLYALMALGVAVLSDTRLDLFVASLLTLQQLILLGRIASARVASSAPWLAQTFTVLSVVTFDIQFARAECNTGPLTFVAVFWGTLVMMLGVVVLFLLASLGRAIFHKDPKLEQTPPTKPGSVKTWESDIDLPVLPSSLDTFEQDRYVAMLAETPQEPAEQQDATFLQDGTLWERFRRRATRSLLIVGAIMYLTVCTRVMQGLVCERDGSQLLLRVELSTVCYQGSHTAAAAIMWILLFAYCIGFPVGAFFALVGFYKRDELVEPKVSARWGYLYRGLEPPFFWFRLATLGVTLVITIVSAASTSTAARIFAGCILFEVFALLTVIFWPFRLVRTNIFNLVTSMLKIVYAIAFLAVADSAGSVDSTAFLAASYPLACVACVAIALRLAWARLRECCSRNGNAADADDYDARQDIVLEDATDLLEGPIDVPEQIPQPPFDVPRGNVGGNSIE